MIGNHVACGEESFVLSKLELKPNGSLVLGSQYDL
jgi:hypothetical protein